MRNWSRTHGADRWINIIHRCHDTLRSKTNATRDRTGQAVGRTEDRRSHNSSRTSPSYNQKIVAATAHALRADAERREGLGGLASDGHNDLTALCTRLAVVASLTSASDVATNNGEFDFACGAFAYVTYYQDKDILGSQCTMADMFFWAASQISHCGALSRRCSFFPGPVDRRGFH